MDALAQLQQALADRYTIEREIGAGGMATYTWPMTSSDRRDGEAGPPERGSGDSMAADRRSPIVYTSRE